MAQTCILKIPLETQEVVIVVFFCRCSDDQVQLAIIQTAIKSNLDLVHILTLYQEELYGPLTRKIGIIFKGYLSLASLDSAIYQTIFNYLPIDSWKMLGVETLFTVGLALSTLIAYSGVVAKE